MSTKTKVLTIPAPNFRTIAIEIKGTSPYLQNKFSKKAQEEIKRKMQAGSTAKSKSKKEPRNFEQDYENSKHVSQEGWIGIPAPAFRNACISACKTVGFHMTKGRLSIFIEADGYDKTDGTPLVKIEGSPEQNESPTRIQNTMNIAVRAMWREWSALVRIRFDADIFTVDDVVNLMMRAGMQVGIGEGRPDSRSSNGLGYGLFDIKNITDV